MPSKLFVIVVWCWVRILLGTAIVGYAFWQMTVLVAAPLQAMTGPAFVVGTVVMTVVALMMAKRTGVLRLRTQAMHRQFLTVTRVKAMVLRIAGRRGIKAPGVLVTDLDRFRNFAAMLDNAIFPDYVIVGEDCDDGLNDQELEAVMAHELRHDDALANRITDVFIYWKYCSFILFAEMVVFWSFGHFINGSVMPVGEFAFVLLARTGWKLVSMVGTAFVSRVNETMTDSLAVVLDIGSPWPLISALEKLVSRQPQKCSTFMSKVMSTHPSVGARRKTLLWLFR